jgi:hypothetical protein
MQCPAVQTVRVRAIAAARDCNATATRTGITATSPGTLCFKMAYPNPETVK